MVDRVLTATPERPAPGAGGNWAIVGGSGGFGSAARAVVGAGFGAHTLNISFDGEPQPDSSNKLRKIGSPGFHRSLALERRLRSQDLVARSIVGDAFDPAVRDQAIADLRAHFGGQLHGLVWALAAPRALDPRTGKTVQSVLRPLGKPATLRTFTGRGSSPSCAAMRFFGVPLTQRRRTSLISIIVTSRYAIGPPCRLVRRPGGGYPPSHAGGKGGEKLSRPEGESR
jgi:enoyl-[acyl-carrier protein] reductase/trans-2-enoyl-CoA reductase (NAD+)